uniref:alpha-amylase n=1 Tax=Cyanistes caeruleus TaxID=156563 RepID=A0A8C0U2K5_CYACU
MGLSGSETDLLHHGLTHSRRPLRKQTRPTEPRPGCRPCRVFLLRWGFIHGHALPGAPARPHEQPPVLQAVPAAARACPWAPSLQGCPCCGTDSPGHGHFQTCPLHCGLFRGQKLSQTYLCHRGATPGHRPCGSSAQRSCSVSGTAAQEQQRQVPAQVRDCRLTSLLDLALEKDYVRSKIAEYLNYLIDIGVAGFRLDAAKHMWPGDIKAFLDKLNNLNTRWFSEGTKPFIYQEVIDLGGEPIKGSEYFGNGRVTEFKYGAKLGTVIRKWNGEKMAYLKNWGEGWGFVPSDRALVFVDNHDNQRGHGAGGASILTFWDARLYKMASGFMLAHPYGFTRVMSSFRWPRYFENGKDINDWVGPPSNADGSTKPVTINEDTTCGNNWVCEHRWRQIRNMVIFRNVVDGEPFSNWWDNGSNQVAFGRGNKGFIIFNNDDWSLNVSLQTGLPAGTYCDVISGQKEGDFCTAVEVHVAADGMANFLIGNEDEDPFIAIHVDAKL